MRSLRTFIDATRPLGGYPRRHTLSPDPIARAARLIADRGRA